MPHFSTGSALESETVLFKWNETDLSQFEEVFRSSGSDCVLSVETNLEEPYQPILQFEVSGGGTNRDYVFYRLLGDDGNPLVIPKNSRITAWMGPRSSHTGTSYGDNIVPLICGWYRDENHHIRLQNALPGNNSLSLVTCNGDGSPDSYARKTDDLKTDHRDSGDAVLMDLTMRKPSTGVDPGGVIKFGGDFGDDVKSVALRDTGWTSFNGGTPVSTSWAAGWDGEIYAAIGILQTPLGAGKTHISKLAIVESIGF